MIDKEKIKKATILLIEGLGYDINDQNFNDTPQRVADMYEEILEGNKFEEKEVVKFVQHSNLVIISDIEAYGFCPHHVLPICYNVSIAYLPNKEVVGISKPIRVVYDCISKLSLQEEATETIADKIRQITGSDDVMVIVTGEHFCMRMRGVKSRGYVTVSAIRGRFHEDYTLRYETLSLIGLKMEK